MEDSDEEPSLDQENFIKTLAEVIGTNCYNDDLAKLFSKVRKHWLLFLKY